jgi:hypothetical protein
MPVEGRGELTAREVQAQDAPAMRALFAHIFKKEMSQALWDWKYARPQSAALGVWRGDELVAHYGGVGFTATFKGKAVEIVQICDVMVDPSVRHVVRRQSPFFLASKAFIERFVGPGCRYSFGYGFPSDRHTELALRLKLYAPVGRIWELGWDVVEPERIPLFLKTQKLEAANFARHAPMLDTLGVQQRTDLGERVVIHRSADFIDWRYLRHPHERYELVLVTHRITGRAIGLCVLKVEAERVLWMEALAPLANLPALAQVARAETWRLERRKLALWCSAPDIDRFGNVTSAKALPITTPANIWTPGPTPEELQDRWWLVPGDSDYL